MSRRVKARRPRFTAQAHFLNLKQMLSELEAGKIGEVHARIVNAIKLAAPSPRSNIGKGKGKVKKKAKKKPESDTDYTESDTDYSYSSSGASSGSSSGEDGPPPPTSKWTPSDERKVLKLLLFHADVVPIKNGSIKQFKQQLASSAGVNRSVLKDIARTTRRNGDLRFSDNTTTRCRVYNKCRCVLITAKVW